MKKTVSQTTLCVLLLLIIGCVVMIPMFRPGFLVTDDGNWMVIRLSAFYQSLRDGQFPVRFLGRLNYSFGYPVSNFLYPGFMYIGSVLHFIGLSFQDSVEAIMIGSVILGGIGAFLWLKTYFSSLSSFIGGLAFLINPYLLYDIYTRGSVGEVLAISIFFWVLYAFDSGRILLYIPALAFLLISHNTAALFCFFILAILLYKKKSYKFLYPTLIALGCSAFFWIPAILEKRFVLFDIVNVSNPLHYFPASMELFLKNAPLGILSIWVLFLQSKKYESEKTFFSWLLLIGAFFISQLSSIFWNMNILQLFVQFPYRLFIFWIIAGSWLLAYTVDLNKKIGVLIAIVSITWLSFGSLHYERAASVVREDGYYSTNEGTTTVANEYMPRWVSVLPIKRANERIELLSGNALITPIEINTNRIHVTVQAKEDSELQINTLYYPGWGAMIDQKPVTIAYNNDLGVMRMPISQGDHTLFMEFRETKSRFLADMITLFCLLIYTGAYVIPSIIRRRVR